MFTRNQFISLFLDPLPEYVVILQCKRMPTGLRPEWAIVKKSEINDLQTAREAAALSTNPAAVSVLNQFTKDVSDFEADGHKWIISGCRAVWEQADHEAFNAKHGL